MEQPKRSFFQRHPGFDAYSLFWLVLFLILAALGRFFLPLLIPAGVVLVYLLFRLLSCPPAALLRRLDSRRERRFAMRAARSALGAAQYSERTGSAGESGRERQRS
mgnify:CR=1 FL=1